MDGLYRIECKYLCAGVVVKNGIVIIAAPILSKFIGKRINVIYQYYTSCDITYIGE
jgi:hypothetical protein